MRNFSSKFVAALVAASMITTPAFAGKFGGGGGFRSSSSSSFSSRSYSTPRSFSSSSYRPTPSYSRPAAPTSRFTSSSSGYNYRPAQTRVVSRPSNSYGGGYNRPTVNNHYYGGGGMGSGFGSSFGGAFTGSLLGNMMFGNHNQTPVYVNNGAPAGGYGDPGYAQAAPVVDNGPGFFGMIFWGIVNLLTLVAIVFGLVWAFRKVRDMLRNR